MKNKFEIKVWGRWVEISKNTLDFINGYAVLRVKAKIGLNKPDSPEQTVYLTGVVDENYKLAVPFISQVSEVIIFPDDNILVTELYCDKEKNPTIPVTTHYKIQDGKLTKLNRFGRYNKLDDSYIELEDGRTYDVLNADYPKVKHI